MSDPKTKHFKKWLRFYDVSSIRNPQEREASARVAIARWDLFWELADALEKCYDVIDHVTAENMAPFIGVDRVTDAYQSARCILKKAKKEGM